MSAPDLPPHLESARRSTARIALFVFAGIALYVAGFATASILGVGMAIVHRAAAVDPKKLEARAGPAALARVDEFLRALEEDRIADAFGMQSKGMRFSTPQEKLGAIRNSVRERMGPLRSRVIETAERQKVVSAGGGDMVRMTFAGTFEKGDAKIAIDVGTEDGAWVVKSWRTTFPPKTSQPGAAGK